MGASGIGTIDVSQIVQQLMKVEGQKLAKLQKTKEGQNVHVSTYGQLKNLLKTMNEKLEKLGTSFDAISYQAASSNATAIATSITGNNVVPGSHTVVVSKLAQADTISSVVTFADKKAALGANETLQFQVGAENFSVAIAATDTLETVRDKINNTSNNNNITASILNTTALDGSPVYRLLISSDKTGAANNVVISGDTGNVFDLTNVVSAAQDADFTFDGFHVLRATNNVSDVLEGLSFTLLTPPPTAQTITSTLTISEVGQNRNETVANALKEFIATYNQIITMIDKTQADPDLRDETLPTLKTALQNVVSREFSVTGNYKTLADVGIRLSPAEEMKLTKLIQPREVDKDGNEVKKEIKREIKYAITGQLMLNTDAKSFMPQFSNVIDKDFSAVRNLFKDATNGMINLLENKTVKEQFLATDKAIDRKNKSLSDRIRDIDRQISKEESRLTMTQQKLVEKYTMLNSTLSKFDRSNSFLQQQLANISNSRKS